MDLERGKSLELGSGAQNPEFQGRERSRILRQEWFGGFEYDWRTNFITEFDTRNFRQLRASDNPQICFVEASGDYAPFPIRVNFDLTYFCNKNCAYCHSSSGHLGPESLKGELSASQICQVISDSERMGVFEITLTGGEPLLKKGVFEILDAAGSLESVFSNVITNGAEITPEIATRIKQSGISKVCISIDGFSSTMDFHRWRGSHPQTVKALDSLLDTGLNVAVISVITRHNVHEIEEFVSFLHRRGVRSHNTSALCDIGRARENWMGLTLDELVDVSKRLNRLSGEMKAEGYNLTFNNAVLCLGEKPESLPIYVYEDACPGWKCIVKANGDVIYDRVWGTDFKIGSVKEKTLFDVWVDSEEIRADYLKRVCDLRGNRQMTDLYYRIGEEGTVPWDWISSLDKYYGSNNGKQSS